MSDDAGLLTVAQLAQLLDVEPEQILNWRLTGDGPPPVNDDPIPRWSPQTVRDWIAAHASGQPTMGVRRR